MKVLLATPAYGGQVYSKYTESLVYTCFMLKMMNIDFEIKFINNQIVTRARNMCSYVFLENTSFTHMLFIDADVVWNPEDVKKLLDHDKECVIGIYPNKQYYWKDNNIILNPSCQMCDVDNSKDIFSNLKKVKYAATGFMLLKRSALERIKNSVETFSLPGSDGSKCTLYNFFDCNIVDNDYLTEDYYFSYLFNKNGGEIFADTSIKLTHMGTHEYGSLIKQ
jgi:choline kinase